MEFSKELFVKESYEPDSQDVEEKSITYWQNVWIRFKRNKMAIGSLAIIIFMILGCIIIPIVSPYTISEQNLNAVNQGMFKDGHIFGTDSFGRDLFVRVWYGTRISLIIAFSAVAINLIIGVIYGGISGYLGGKTDEVMMRIVDVVISIPHLIIVMLLMVILKPGMVTIILAYATVGWTGMARVVRGQVLHLKELDYVVASRLLGSGALRIIIKDLFPNAMGVIMVHLALTIPRAIFTEAFLSYIGLGVQIPLASLGTLVTGGSAAFRLYPHVIVIPALFMCILMLAFNVFSDSLRNIIDPKMRR